VKLRSAVHAQNMQVTNDFQVQQWGSSKENSVQHIKCRGSSSFRSKSSPAQSAVTPGCNPTHPLSLSKLHTSYCYDHQDILTKCSCKQILCISKERKKTVLTPEKNNCILKHVRDLIASSYKKVTDRKKGKSLCYKKPAPLSALCSCCTHFSILTITL
jgi:hypothetical protein